jgi:hypothetical protein
VAGLNGSWCVCSLSDTWPFLLGRGHPGVVYDHAHESEGMCEGVCHSLTSVLTSAGAAGSLLVRVVGVR